MDRLRASGIFLVAAGVFVTLPSIIGDAATLAAGICLVVAGVLSAIR